MLSLSLLCVAVQAGGWLCEPVSRFCIHRTARHSTDALHHQTWNTSCPRLYLFSTFILSVHCMWYGTAVWWPLFLTAKSLIYKEWMVRCWCGYLSGVRCELLAHCLPDASDIPKSNRLLPYLNPEWFTFLVPAYPCRPGREAIKRV